MSAGQVFPESLEVHAAEIDRLAAGIAAPDAYKLAAALRSLAASEDPLSPLHLLVQVFDMHLRASDPVEPFGPMIAMNGKRSMVPSDLTDDQAASLRHLLEAVETPALQCRLADVLWVSRRDFHAARAAVPAYLAVGSLLEDPDMWPPSMELYERAIRLARSLGRGGPLLEMALRHLADRVAHYAGGDPSFFTARALELLQEFRFGDAGVLSGYALIGAKRHDAAGDPYSARVYWNIAAVLLSRAGRTDEAEEARIEYARTWVAEADLKEARGDHGAAQSHLEDAIQAYRNIPGCKRFLPELHRRLDAAGVQTLKLMGTVSSGPIDISPLVRAARERIVGLPLADAIYALACIAPAIDPVKLREQVNEVGKATPFSSMFSRVTYDRSGRVVHKSPGLFTDDPDEHEQAIEDQVSRQADRLRHLTVTAQILPALMTLLGEHVVEDADVLTLLEGSTLVPEGREGLFAMGLAAGFRRDMITAMHLLIPQLEHALRVLLRSEGTITASLDQEGIQSEWPLGRLLSPAVVQPVLPDEIAFELRSLLIFKGSSNIRNRLCHGLLEADDFATANVLYTWWLLLQLTLHGTPGFQAWATERLLNSMADANIDASKEPEVQKDQ